MLSPYLRKVDTVGMLINYYTKSESDARYPPNSRSINTTSPLSGGGDLSADRTLSIADAQADGTTKGAASFTANDFNSSAGNISIDYVNGQSATGVIKGFLAPSDFVNFNNKLGSLNGLTSASQTFATGTTGSDFNISSSSTTHTFNIPTASSTVRGLLSTSDWTTFNSKVSPSRTITVSSGTDISVTGGTQDLSANRTWTVNNISTLSTVLGRGNTALFDINLGAAGNSNGYTYLVRRLVSGVNYSGAFGASAAAGGGVYMSTSNGTLAQDQVFRLIPNSAAPSYSPDGGPTSYSMLHAGNHIAGVTGSVAYTGAEVPASLSFNVDGHYTSNSKRTLTASDIGAIANGTSPQTANYNITGTGTVGTQLIVPIITSGSATGAIAAVGGLIGGQQGGHIVMYGGNHASRAGDISFHAGTGTGLQGERLTVDGNTGSVGVNETGPGAQLDIRGVSSSTGTAFRVRNSTPSTIFQVDNNMATKINGSVWLATTTVTGNTTLDATHYTVRVNNSANVNITLPTASTVAGIIYNIKKVSNNAFTVTIVGTIDGATNLVFSGFNENIQVQSNGTSYDVL